MNLLINMNKTFKSNHQKRSRRQNRRKPNERPATARTGRTAEADLRYATPLFPPRFRKKLFYTEVALSKGAAAGTCSSYFFSANGLFDPNISGTGHQPMGFDQMMLMYEQYTVVSSKITIHAINASAASILAAFQIYLSPDTTNITVPSQLIENGYITPQMVLMPIFLVGSAKQQSLTCDIATYMGRNRNMRALVDDPNLFGTVAANPTEQVYFALLVYDPTLANAVTVDFTVDIEFEAIFWEPRKLTQS
jgi:hypothetical protein